MSENNSLLSFFFFFLTHCILTCFRHCAKYFRDRIYGLYLSVLIARRGYLHVTYQRAFSSGCSRDLPGLIQTLRAGQITAQSGLSGLPNSSSSCAAWLLGVALLWTPCLREEPSWWLCCSLRPLKPLLPEVVSWKARWDPQRHLPGSPKWSGRMKFAFQTLALWASETCFSKALAASPTGGTQNWQKSETPNSSFLYAFLVSQKINGT